MFELEESERHYLLTVLRAAHTQLLHELHHADSADFKQQLRHRIEINESITAKIQNRVSASV